ncbi:MAG: DUF4097 family beta strand repeat-containing protein [Streptosporangiaceae bacterium]
MGLTEVFSADAEVDSLCSGTHSRAKSVMAGLAVKAAAAILAWGLAMFAVAGCSVSVGRLQHRTNSYSVASRVQILVVNAQVGGVHVRGGDSGTVTVTEHVTFEHTPPVTTHRAAGGTLVLDSNCPALETCSVGYDITVPRAMTVRVSDNVGVIRLDLLSGQVTAHTNAGNIDLGSVSGPIDVSSHAGSILGQDVSSAHATLRLSVGDIDVTFSAAPATITAAATVGSVTLRVPRSVSYAVDVSASLGSIQVSVARNPASTHVITASTKTGSITIQPAP